MLSKLVALVTTLAIVLVQACSHSAPLYLICLLDMSASVETGAQANQFEALEPIFKQLKRGDTIIIIPITGDALIEAQGNILRFRLSTKRSTYDSDLRRLRREAQERLRSLKEAAEVKPFTRTDLLGAVEVCAEEIQAAPAGARKAVVILSDFLQDDRQFNFTREPRVATTARSAEFAKELARSRAALFNGASVYLGFLRSEDLKRLPEARRAAVRLFGLNTCEREARLTFPQQSMGRADCALP
jgi:Arc/MetJ family transcription regulator